MSTKSLTDKAMLSYHMQYQLQQLGTLPQEENQALSWRKMNVAARPERLDDLADMITKLVCYNIK